MLKELKKEAILSKRNKFLTKTNKLQVSILNFEITFNDDPFMCDVGLTCFCAKCHAKCVGCHNPESWDENNGVFLSLETIKLKIKNKLPLIKHVVFCGGEFTLYSKQLSELLIWSKLQGLRTILYTGKQYTQLLPVQQLFCDIIIDGVYIEDLQTNRFPASSNQNVYVNNIKLSEKEILNLPVNKEKM